MSLRQQQMVQVLSKCCQKYFLYQSKPGRVEDTKVRLRNGTHRVELADDDIKGEQTQSRNKDKFRGLLSPDFLPYEPVGGSWPVLELDDLVLNTIASQLDPKVKAAVRRHFEKGDVFKKTATKDEGVLKDLTDLHQSVTAGYAKIKVHLRETEDRMRYVHAGNEFQQHVRKTLKERRRLESRESKQASLQTQPTAGEVAQGRIRQEEIRFLQTLMDLIDKLLLIRIRHLKSSTPIRLDTLRPGATMNTSPTSSARAKRPGLVRYQYNSPVHNFKEQILMEAPNWWAPPPSWLSRTLTRSTWTSGLSVSSTAATSARSIKPGSAHSSASSSRSVVTSVPSTHSPAAGKPVQRPRSASVHTGDPREPARADKEGQPGAGDGPAPKETSLAQMYRQRWPPLWQGLAASEQGYNLTQPLTQAAPQPKAPETVRRRSLSDIKSVRKEFAAIRIGAEKIGQEYLDRANQEKMEFFRVSYSTLRNVPFTRFFGKQQAIIDRKLLARRKARQRRELYECEVNTSWYKALAEEEYAIVGKKDEEVNALLARIRQHFTMSPTEPKFGKAKMALMVMSLPATAVCHVHVQRALDFLLQRVMQAPRETLALWLATRGLPLVLTQPSALNPEGRPTWDL